MKVLFFRRDTVDCTSDPHPVNFDDWEEALSAVERVLDSDLVKYVECSSVFLTPEGKKIKEFDNQDHLEKYESDDFDKSNWTGKGKLQKSKDSKKHGTYGLYMTHDAEVDGAHHLPPGFTGAKEALEIVRKNLKRLYYADIRIVWEFAGDSSCSDYIQIPSEDYAGAGIPVVDFSNQDWWTKKEGYKEHCEALSEVIGIDEGIIPTTYDDDE